MRSADESEFRAFVAARWARLVRTAHLLCGDRHEAEDLLREPPLPHEPRG